jgi:dTMP kinase
MANGLDRNWCWNSEIGLLKPDLIIYIQLDPLVASTRVGYGDEIYEKLEFQSKVKQAFDSFTDLFVVDGLLKQEKIQEIVWDKVMDLVKEPRIDFFYFTNQHV